MVKVTTRKQFNLLIKEMEDRPIVARGVRASGEIKARLDKVWIDISEKLNRVGPPVRTADEWKRVWIHFKAKLKKKISQNERNLYVTGSGPFQEISLSSLEQASADLLHLESGVDSISNTFGTSFSEFARELLDNEILDGTQKEAETKQPEEIEEYRTPEKASQQPKKSLTIEERKFNLLQEQTRTQTEVLATMQKIEKHLYKKNEILKDIKDLKRKEYEVLKEIKDIKKRKFNFLVEEQILNRQVN